MRLFAWALLSCIFVGTFALPVVKEDRSTSTTTDLDERNEQDTIRTVSSIDTTDTTTNGPFGEPFGPGPAATSYEKENTKASGATVQDDTDTFLRQFCKLSDFDFAACIMRLKGASPVHTGLLDALPFGPGPILPGPGEGNPADTSVGCTSPSGNLCPDDGSSV